eukprot:g6277.t1
MQLTETTPDTPGARVLVRLWADATHGYPPSSDANRFRTGNHFGDICELLNPCTAVPQTPTPPPPSSAGSSPVVGNIIGGLVGGVVGVLALVAVYIIRRKRLRARGSSRKAKVKAKAKAKNVSAGDGLDDELSRNLLAGAAARDDSLTSGSEDTTGEWEGTVPLQDLQAAAASIGTTTSAASTVMFSFRDLQRLTNNFHQSKRIGTGGFADVYRAKLPGGTAVAIKVLKIERVLRDAERVARGIAHKFSGMAQFRREVDVLGKYRHPNIVVLLGHSIDDSAEGRARPCLVYEYMAGASLHYRLRVQPGGRADKRALTARERIVIASDVARGLVFLHTAAEPPIVHQDVKADNILLARRAGGPIYAKIADFGTARLAPVLALTGTAAPSHVSTAHVVGTQGYMPMEYAWKGQVSAKTDAFAFGVVLLEMLTGRPAINDMREMLAEDLEDDINASPPQIESHLDASAGHWGPGQAAVLARFAARCTARQRTRCTVADIIGELDALRDGLPGGNGCAAPPAVEHDIDMESALPA